MPEIRDLEVDEYLYESVTLDATQVQDEFSRVSGDVAYWSSQYARAHRRYLRAKVLLKEAKATAWATARANLDGGLGKRPTVDDLKSAVDLDSEVREATSDLIDSEYERERIRGVIEAVRAKRDMLITLGAHIRTEMQGNPKINQTAKAAQLWSDTTEDEADDWGDDD